MKTYNEMAQSVFARIEEYEIEKQNKQRRTKRAALIAAPLCLAAVVTVSALHSGIILNETNIPVAEKDLITSSTNTCEEKDGASNVNSDNSQVSQKENDESVFSQTDNTNAYSGTNIVSSENTSSAFDAAETASSYTEGSDIASKNTEIIEEENSDELFVGDTADMLGIIIKDGVMYIQFDVCDDGFTLDEKIGYASEFEGTYQIMQDIQGEVYTVKESQDVLVVKLSNDGTVVLARNGQIIVNGMAYFATGLDPDVYTANEYLGHVSDFEIINVPYLTYDVELSPNDEVYTVSGKDDELSIRQENGNIVIFSKVQY